MAMSRGVKREEALAALDRLRKNEYLGDDSQEDIQDAVDRATRDKQEDLRLVLMLLTAEM